MNKKISVSDEVAKVIESSKKSADQILRECLGLGSGGFVARGGIILPEGTQLLSFYKNRTYYATIKDGAIDFMNERFASPSAAAVKVTERPTNGWDFWRCKFPGDEKLIILSSLRKARQKRGS